MSLRRLAHYALFFTPLLVLPLVASASIDANSTGLVEAGRAAGLNSICSGDASACIADLVGRFLNMALGFIGLVLFVYVVYGGVLWMTSAGDDKQVVKAKDTLKNAVIGVFLVVLAFGISSFVLSRVGEVAGGSQIGAAGGSTGGTSETAGAPGTGTSGTSETGGSICRCTCVDGGGTVLSLPVASCSESTCSLTTCRASCGILGGSTVAPTCGSTGTIAAGPDANERAILITAGDTASLADGCIAAMRRTCVPGCRADQSLRECFSAASGGLTASVTRCMDGPVGTLPPGGLAPPCNHDRTIGAYVLGY